MKHNKIWTWLPSLYFAEGLPYTIVMSVSIILYKRFGISNAEIALYTSWFYLPWVIKPLWSPFVDLLKTKRWWTIAMQLFIGAGMAGIAFTIPTTFFLQATMAFFWLLAFSSATHDIAADGFYLLALNKEQQGFFIGIRGTFYRLAMLFGQGVLVILAGWLERKTGQIRSAWLIVFLVSAGIFIILGIYHLFFLPRPADDQARANNTIRTILAEFGRTIRDFFLKKDIGVALLFILTFRLGEAQLLKLASPFLLDPVDKGGLGLDTQSVGFVYGTVGLVALLLGGILGGIVLAKGGLKKWLWPMAFAVQLPNLVYIYMALFQPADLFIINSCVALEQFGYGFGVTAFMMYLMLFSDGKYKTSHFAFCTGFMALGMMLPGMISGWIQEQVGYLSFFIWVMICTIPGFIALGMVGKRLKE